MKGMKMVRKVLSLLLCAAMVVTLMPESLAGIFAADYAGRAQADTAVGIYINDSADGSGNTVAVTDEVTSGSGWSYDAEENVLTLNGFNGSYIGTEIDLTVKLTGANTVTLHAVGDNTKALNCVSSKTMTFEKTTDSGTDTLTVQGKNTSSSLRLVSASGQYVLNGGTLILNGESNLIDCEPTVRMKNDANLRVTLNATAQCNGPAVIEEASANGEAEITATGSSGAAVYYAQLYGSGDLTVNASEGMYAVGGIGTLKGQAGKVTLKGMVSMCAGVNDLTRPSLNERVVLTNHDSYYWRPAEYQGSNLISGLLLDAEDTPITDAVFEFQENAPFGVSRTEWSLPQMTVGKSMKSYANEDDIVWIRPTIHGGKQNSSGSYSIRLKEGGSLPAGLSLNTTQGTISGTPTEAMEAGSFVIVVSDFSTPANTAEVTVSYDVIQEPDLYLTINDTPYEMKQDASGEGWSYAADTKTLTLNGFNGSYIGTEADLTVKLKGANTVTLQADGSNTKALNCVSSKTMTFEKTTDSGTDTLTVQGENTSSSLRLVSASGQYVLNGGTLILNGESNLIDCEPTVRMKNDANLRVTLKATAQCNGPAVIEEASATGKAEIAAVGSSGRAVYYTELYGSGDLTVNASAGMYAVGGTGTLKGQAGKVTLKGMVSMCAGVNDLTRPSLNERVVLTNHDSYYWRPAEYQGSNLISGLLLDAEDKPITDAVFEFQENAPFGVSRTEWSLPQMTVGKSMKSYANEDDIVWIRPTIHGGKQNSSGSYSIRLKEGGSLPAGLSLNTTQGTISGTPTEETEAGSFVIEVSDFSTPANTEEVTVSFDTIQVSDPVTSVTVEPETMRLRVGETAQLSATVLPEEATIRDVTVASADNKVANVDAATLVREADSNISTMTVSGRSVGKTTVTVTTKQGNLTDTCEVAVVEATPQADAGADEDGIYLENLVPGATYSISESTGTVESISRTADGDGRIYIPKTLFKKTVLIVKTNEDADLNSDAQSLEIGNIKLILKESLLPVTGLSATYTAVAQEPVFGTTDGGDVLVQDTDYTVTYAVDQDAIVKGRLDAAGKPLGAGTYIMTVTGIGDYQGSFAKTMTIAPRTVTITPVSGQKKTYGTSDPVLAYSAAFEAGAGEIGADATGYLTESGEAAEILNWLKDDFETKAQGLLTRAGSGQADGEYAGEYAIMPGTLTAGADYTVELSDETVNFTVEAAAQTLTGRKELTVVKSGTLTAAQLATAVTGAKGTLTFEISTDDGADKGYASITDNTLTACDFTGELAEETAGTVMVSAKASALDVNDDGKPEYLADDEGVTFVVNVRNVADAQVSVGTKEEASDEFVARTEYEIGFDAEDFILYAVAEVTGSGGSYDWMSSDEAVATVTPLKAVIDAGTGEAAYTETANGASDATAVRVHVVKKGEAFISVHYSSDTSDGTADLKLTVGGAQLTEERLPVSGLEVTYNAAAQEPVFGGSDGGSPESSPVRDTDYTVSYAVKPGAAGRLDAYGKPVGAGIYVVTLDGMGNYAGSFTREFTIGAKTVTVTPVSGQRKVYGAAEPTVFEYTTDLEGALAADFENAVRGSLTREAGEYVGSYVISMRELSDGKVLTAGEDYAIDFASEPVVFTITAAQQSLSVVKQLSVYADGSLDTEALMAALAGAQGNVTLALESGSEYGTLTGDLAAGYGFTACGESVLGEASEGIATIRATASAYDVNGDGEPEYAADTEGVTFRITVRKKAQAVITISGASGAEIAGELALTKKYGDGEFYLNPQVTVDGVTLSGTDISKAAWGYTSGNEAVAEVSEKGYVTVKDVGSARITISYESASAKGSVVLNLTVDKADAPNAPTGLKGVAPTWKGGSDGKITGTTTAMEYSSDASFKAPAGTDCDEGETKRLTSGIWYVRYKETDTAQAGKSVAVIVPEPLSEKGWTVTFDLAKTVPQDAYVMEMNDENGDLIYALTYTGSALKPGVIVRHDGKMLVEGTDYTLKYTNNTNVTRASKSLDSAVTTAASVTVTGKGIYSGKVVLPFRVLPKDISPSADTEGKIGTGSAIIIEKGKTPNPAVTYQGNVLKNGKDYTVSAVLGGMGAGSDGAGSEDDGAGTSGSYITITGQGNFTGARDISVTELEKGEFRKRSVKVKLAKVNKIYNGKAQTLTTGDASSELFVTDASGIGLNPYDPATGEGEYTVTYSANVNAGTVKVTVNGVGSHTGTVKKSFKIAPNKTASFEVVPEKTTYSYVKTGVKPALTVTATLLTGEKYTLTEGRDYKVTYSSNKKVGTAKCKLTFLGNYKGAKYTGTNGDVTIVKAILTGAAGGSGTGGNTYVIAGDMPYKKSVKYQPKPYVIVDGSLLTKSDYDMAYSETGKLTLGDGETKDCTVTVKAKAKSAKYADGTDGAGITAAYRVLPGKDESGSQRIDISKAKLTLVRSGNAVKSVAYTGGEITFSESVNSAGGKGTDTTGTDLSLKIDKNTTLTTKQIEQYFDIYYADNVEKGKATIILSAKPDVEGQPYIGACSGTFTISNQVIGK